MIPRRNRLEENTDAELAIRAVMLAIEAMPADVRLTDAVVLLGQAREKLADYIDTQQPSATYDAAEAALLVERQKSEPFGMLIRLERP